MHWKSVGVAVFPWSGGEAEFEFRKKIGGGQCKSWCVLGGNVHMYQAVLHTHFRWRYLLLLSQLLVSLCGSPDSFVKQCRQLCLDKVNSDMSVINFDQMFLRW